MHESVQKLIYIQNEVKSILNNKDSSKLPKIIAVSKTFELDKILPLINHGHLDFGENKEKSTTTPTNASSEKEPVRWGIGRGRLAKKMGSIFSDFREKCEELDEKKRIERQGKPSNTELIDAAMVDIKKQIDEFEAIVRKKTGTSP